MKALRDKIKTIIFNNGGLPGLNQADYMDEMRSILMNELTADDKATLNQNHVRIELLILELSAEIADDIL